MDDNQAARSTAAFDRLLTELRPRLLRIVAYRGVPPEDAEDLLQEVMLQLTRKRHLVHHPERWLPRALDLSCRQYWRGRSRNRIFAMDQALLDLVVDTRDTDQESKVLRRNLGILIEKQPWRCREILKMRFLLGYDAREIADALGYKPSSIDKVKRRCLASLNKSLTAAGLGRVSQEEDS